MTRHESWNADEDDEDCPCLQFLSLRGECACNPRAELPTGYSRGDEIRWDHLAPNVNTHHTATHRRFVDAHGVGTVIGPAIGGVMCVGQGLTERGFFVPLGHLVLALPQIRVRKSTALTNHTGNDVTETTVTVRSVLRRSHGAISGAQRYALYEDGCARHADGRCRCRCCSKLLLPSMVDVIKYRASVPVGQPIEDVSVMHFGHITAVNSPPEEPDGMDVHANKIDEV